jgi:ArsR family transcriptional regulator, cadmium/lead-responsive transcriptional repressor
MIVSPSRAVEPVVAARFFRVLGDATRVRILQLLEEGEHSVGQLVAELGQPQPRVSTHLACLRHCGFVTAERRGKEVFYGLALGGLEELLNDAADVMAPIARRLATCTRVGPEWV